MFKNPDHIGDPDFSSLLLIVKADGLSQLFRDKFDVRPDNDLRRFIPRFDNPFCSRFLSAASLMRDVSCTVSLRRVAQ